jgi:hypothetical protein
MSVSTGNFEGMGDIGDKYCLLGSGVKLIYPLIASTCGEYLRGFRCQTLLQYVNIGALKENIEYRCEKRLGRLRQGGPVGGVLVHGVCGEGGQRWV